MENYNIKTPIERIQYLLDK